MRKCNVLASLVALGCISALNPRVCSRTPDSVQYDSTSERRTMQLQHTLCLPTTFSFLERHTLRGGSDDDSGAVNALSKEAVDGGGGNETGPALAGHINNRTIYAEDNHDQSSSTKIRGLDFALREAVREFNTSLASDLV